MARVSFGLSDTSAKGRRIDSPDRGDAQRSRSAAAGPGPGRPAQPRADGLAALGARRGSHGVRGGARGGAALRLPAARHRLGRGRAQPHDRAAVAPRRARRGGGRASCCGPGAPLFEYWGHEASWIPLELYPAFEFRRREFRAHPWWGDLVGEQPQASRRSCCAAIRDGGPAAVGGDGGARQQGLVGPERHQAGGRRAVVERRAGDPRAQQLPADLRPGRAGDPGAVSPPSVVHRGWPRGAAAGRARRPRLGDHGHAGLDLAAAATARPIWSRRSRGCARRARSSPARSHRPATDAQGRLDPARGPRAGGAAGAGAAARRPRRAAIALRPAAVGPRRASRACSGSRPCSRSSSPRRSACTGTTACRCWRASTLVARVDLKAERKAGRLRVRLGALRGQGPRDREDGTGKPRARPLPATRPPWGCAPGRPCLLSGLEDPRRPSRDFLDTLPEELRATEDARRKGACATTGGRSRSRTGTRRHFA